VSRARFIAAARIEFLAEVIYYTKRNTGWGSALPRPSEKPRLVLSLFLLQDHRPAQIPAGSCWTVFRSR